MDYGEFTEEEVTNFRTKLRPLMYNDRLTGYNIYPKFLGSDEKFVISYMHNGLGDDSSKPRNSHKKKLLEKLERQGIGILNSSISTRTIARSTSYKYFPLDSWEPPDEDTIAYGENDEILPLNELKDYIGKIILQANEQELIIGADTKKEFSKILNVLKDFCHKYEVDDEWAIKRSDGELKEIGDKYSWGYPPIIIPNVQNSAKGFRIVSKLFRNKGISQFATLMTKDGGLKIGVEKALGIQLMQTSVLANRVFADLLSGISF